MLIIGKKFIRCGHLFIAFSSFISWLICVFWSFYRQAMALQQAVALCMDHCQDAELTGDNNWYKTVILAGGSACLPGLSGLSYYLQLILFVIC